MKKLILLIMAWSLFSPSLWAFEGECMVPGEKFASCSVSVLERDSVPRDLSVQYALEKYQKLNRIIPGEKIRKVSVGKAGRQDVERTMLIGPLTFFSFFGHSRKGQDMYGIDYLNEKGKLKFLLIRVKPDDAITFGTSLKKISDQAK